MFNDPRIAVRLGAEPALVLFAPSVVAAAAEVRKLAKRSQLAAQEIGTVASSSVERAERAGKQLGPMVSNIKKLSELEPELTAASEERSSGVGQINSAVTQLSHTTQQNASSSEQLAATSVEMSGHAELFQQTLAFFRLEAAGRAAPARNARAGTQAASKSKETSKSASPRRGPARAPARDSALAVDESHFAQFCTCYQRIHPCFSR